MQAAKVVFQVLPKFSVARQSRSLLGPVRSAGLPVGKPVAWPQVAAVSRPFDVSRMVHGRPLSIKDQLYARYPYMTTQRYLVENSERQSILDMEAAIRDKSFFEPFSVLVEKKGALDLVTQEEFVDLQMNFYRCLVDFYVATGAQRVSCTDYINCLDHAVLCKHGLSLGKKLVIITKHLEDAQKLMEGFNYTSVEQGLAGDVAVFFDQSGAATHYARVVSQKGELLRLESALGQTGFVIQHSLEQTMSTYGDPAGIQFFRLAETV